MASKKPKRFPKRELNIWLRSNTEWDHQQWLDLISELDKNGFENWTGNQEGLDAIGVYIEDKRQTA